MREQKYQTKCIWMQFTVEKNKQFRHIRYDPSIQLVAFVLGVARINYKMTTMNRRRSFQRDFHLYHSFIPVEMRKIFSLKLTRAKKTHKQLRGFQIKLKLFCKRFFKITATFWCFYVKKKEVFGWKFSSFMWHFAIAPALTFDFQFHDLK